ncbi:hypothetical protein BKA64DRAFT_412154 [Cadophora sp. MPI-SDFR-AT-0126]|nr:hypothetical protein BKA64DRAFT_412154 [Leotiomycetes sp. MPI-SDFR-AT-0126]
MKTCSPVTCIIPWLDFRALIVKSVTRVAQPDHTWGSIDTTPLRVVLKSPCLKTISFAKMSPHLHRHRHWRRSLPTNSLSHNVAQASLAGQMHASLISLVPLNHDMIFYPLCILLCLCLISNIAPVPAITLIPSEPQGPNPLFGSMTNHLLSNIFEGGV